MESVRFRKSKLQVGLLHHRRNQGAFGPWPPKQGCGVVRSRIFFGGVGVVFLTTLGVGVGFFVRLRKSIWIIFYITLLNWEFVLNGTSSFEICCWNRDFLLCTIILSGFGNFGRSESDWEILERPELDSDILLPTSQPCSKVYNIIASYIANCAKSSYHDWVNIVTSSKHKKYNLCDVFKQTPVTGASKFFCTGPPKSVAYLC